MPDTIIPVTYAGGQSYTLIFREGPDGLMVRRDYNDIWKPVADLRMHPLDRNPAKVVVEINGDLKQGVPIYAWMRPEDWERLKRLRG